MDRASAAINALIDLMARLRDPEAGCPWDLEQTFASIAPYTIEEAYEVADAIARGDLGDLRGELGDLLFQVVFHARMAQEAGAFDLADVARGIVDKMIARHPHVFSDGAARTAAEQSKAWEAMKAQERAARRAEASALDDVPLALPALTRAEKLTKRAARIGFDWPGPDAVLEKLDEELAELAEARRVEDADAIEDEFGDVLFVLANLGRKLGVDPEAALRRANGKFERRFRAMEARLRQAPGAEPPSLAVMEAHWRAVKAAERG